MSNIVYKEVESDSGLVTLSFGDGLFEILTLGLQSKDRNHIGFGSAHWYTTESDGTNKVVPLLSGWFRSIQPLPMVGSRLVQGPGSIYGVTDLPSGAYLLMRVSYRRVK